MRKNEADKFRWESVNFSQCALRIEPTESFNGKSEDSLDAVQVDPALMNLFRQWRKSDPTVEFVLQSEVKPPTKPIKYYHYRCKATFNRLAKWLRSKGITAHKKIHELRQEAGSQVKARFGIHAASRFLRHADIGITAQFYLAEKRKVTVEFNPSENTPEKN